MEENRLAKIMVDICLDVHRQLGPGLFEKVYEEVIFYECMRRHLHAERQKSIRINYNEVDIGPAYRADLLIEEKLLIEIKSVEELGKVHYRQVVSYLKLGHFKLGLLINFNVPLIKDGIHRIVNNL